MQEVFRNKFSIPAKGFKEFTLKTKAIDGIFYITVEVIQQSGRVDDVRCYVMDGENWKTWKHNLQAIRAGATTTNLPKLSSFVSAKIIHGAISFIPPKPDTYYVILDNTYSPFTSKIVDVIASWIWFENAEFRFVERILISNKWKEIMELINNAKNSLDNEKTADCCNALRMSLISTWIKVCEIITGEKIITEKGKTPDVGNLARGLVQKGVSEESVGMIKRVWSYVSEMAHVEKRGAHPPTNIEAGFAFKLTISTIAYLLLLLTDE